jgi:hypothetical protein
MRSTLLCKSAILLRTRATNMAGLVEKFDVFAEADLARRVSRNVDAPAVRPWANPLAIVTVYPERESGHGNVLICGLQCSSQIETVLLFPFINPPGAIPAGRNEMSGTRTACR